MARWQPAERDARYRKARKAGRPPVVSEGDSWFDYPMYLNIIDRIDDAKRFAIKRLEFSGDTVARMVGAGATWDGVNALAVVVEAERPRFVLFSGGGNDIVGKEFRGALRPYVPGRDAAWHLGTDQWARLRAGGEAAYAKLVTTVGPLAPVFAHGYDYMVPSDRPAKYDGIAVSGPWVWPEMERAGIPRDGPLRGEIVRAMIDWFNDVLGRLEREHRGLFAHINLRGTLTPADWQNEIHPTREGFALLTREVLRQLDVKLTPTLAAHDAMTFGGLG